MPKYTNIKSIFIYLWKSYSKFSRLHQDFQRATSGKSAYSIGRVNQFIRDSNISVLGTYLKAKGHLPRGKKSFDARQKLVRLGANEIKNIGVNRLNIVCLFDVVLHAKIQNKRAKCKGFLWKFFINSQKKIHVSSG